MSQAEFRPGDTVSIEATISRPQSKMKGVWARLENGHEVHVSPESVRMVTPAIQPGDFIQTNSVFGGGLGQKGTVLAVDGTLVWVKLITGGHLTVGMSNVTRLHQGNKGAEGGDA